MTSDAIRQPGEPARPSPEPTAPSASETIPPRAEEPSTRPAEENAAPAAGEVSGEAASASEAETAAAATTEASSADAADAVMAAETVTTADTVTTAEAVAATDAASDAPADASPRRRERVTSVMQRLGVFAIAVALLVGGIALGSTIFRMTRPATDVVPAGQVGTTAEQPALVTQEFIAAMRTSDFDALRSSLQPEAAIHFEDEIQRRAMKSIDKVEVLGTHVFGERSATEILLQYKTDEDIPRSINLVILVDGGKIEGFR